VMRSSIFMFTVWRRGSTRMQQTRPAIAMGRYQRARVIWLEARLEVLARGFWKLGWVVSSDVVKCCIGVWTYYSTV
jgi:hypothetical protein